MKNLLTILTICLLSLLSISCEKDEKELFETNSSIENEKKFESFRKDFASLYSESTKVINKDIKEYRLSANFKVKEEGISFDEFSKDVPGSDMYSEKALILLESAFNNRGLSNAKNKSDSAFGANEMLSLAILFDSWEEDNLTEEEAMNKLLYGDSVGKNLTQKSDCKFFCKVWNGIKAAARWVWKNYKEITAFVSMASTIAGLVK